MNLKDIVDEVNVRTPGRPIGTLQRFRTDNLGMQRLNRKLFGDIHNSDWTFHRGGREELQFNLGREEGLKEGDLRFGVAFSLEPSRTMPTIDTLVPKIARFNEYLRQHPEEFASLRMWHYLGDRSSLRSPEPFRADLVQPGAFLFMGRLTDSGAPDYESILTVFDGLMPLYRFVEAAGTAQRPALTLTGPLRLGRPVKAVSAAASLPERLLNIELRHNALQLKLYDELVSQLGYNHVATEQPAAGGGQIDALVSNGAIRIIYEIKVASTARGCIREAMGQLLDYACWPGGPPVDKIVIAGEPALASEAAAYLNRLNVSFPVPLEYRSITLS